MADMMHNRGVVAASRLAGLQGCTFCGLSFTSLSSQHGGALEADHRPQYKQYLAPVPNGSFIPSTSE